MHRTWSFQPVSSVIHVDAGLWDSPQRLPAVARASCFFCCSEDSGKRSDRPSRSRSRSSSGRSRSRCGRWRQQCCLPFSLVTWMPECLGMFQQTCTFAVRHHAQAADDCRCSGIRCLFLASLQCTSTCSLFAKAASLLSPSPAMLQEHKQQPQPQPKQQPLAKPLPQPLPQPWRWSSSAQLTGPLPQQEPQQGRAPPLPIAISQQGRPVAGRRPHPFAAAPALLATTEGPLAASEGPLATAPCPLAASPTRERRS